MERECGHWDSEWSVRRSVDWSYAARQKAPALPEIMVVKVDDYSGLGHEEWIPLVPQKHAWSSEYTIHY